MDGRFALTLLAILLEIFYINIAKDRKYLKTICEARYFGNHIHSYSSYSIVQFPFVENPAYSSIFTILLELYHE